MLTAPFSAKPLSQVAVHRDPKVKGPFGLEQDRKPRGRSTGLHFFTLGNRKATESSLRYKLRIHNCLPDIFKTSGTTRTVIVSFAHVYSYLGKQEVQDSTGPVMSTWSYLCQSNQNPCHTQQCMLSHSCALPGGCRIWWRYCGEPLSCCIEPLEKKCKKFRKVHILCVIRRFTLVLLYIISCIFLYCRTICNTNLHMWVWSCSTFQRPDRSLWCLPLGCSLSGRWSYTENQRRRAPGNPQTLCCPEMETKWGSTFLLQKTIDKNHIHVKSTHKTLVYNDSSIISMWWICKLT